MTSRSQPMDDPTSPADQDVLLNLLLEEEGYRLCSNSSIRPIDKTGPLPLSFAQQRLWFLSQLEGNSAIYNIPATVKLIGTLKVAALEHAIVEIIQRHAVLRTSFSMLDGQPVQVIHALTTTNLLQVIDWSSLPALEHPAAVQRLAVEEAQHPFDLNRDPLLRVTLVILNQTEHILLLTMHHIVSDGWSIGIFVRELSELYKAFVKGEPSPLPPLPIQYADFADWQHQSLTPKKMTSAITYWKQHLGGQFPVLQLPTDRLPPQVETHWGARQTLVLSKPITETLKQLSQQEGVTLFMTMMAAFKILLYHYSEQEKILVGTPIMGRNQTETEDLIGCFVNTLPLYTDLSGNPSFLELLDRVRQVTLAAYTHQDLPFEKLVQELLPQRNVNQDALFRVWFAFQNFPMPVLDLPGLTLTVLTLDSTGVQFDLECFVLEGTESLNVWINYNSNVFESVTIAQLLTRFERLLLAITEYPNKNLRALVEKLEEVEKQQRLLRAKELETLNIQSLKMIKRNAKGIPK